MKEQWRGFKGTHWISDVNVRDFIQNNYTPYDGDSSFLAGPTEATNKLWGDLQKLQHQERAQGGVLDMETEIVSGITAYGPGYISENSKDLEKVVGLQTDKPLKRAFMPYGGIKMAQEACTTNGYTPNPKFDQIFNEYHKTHNQAVYDAYTPEMRLARKNKILTGLPDTYGRGRIVGDYRRVALYGIDFLIEQKQADLKNCGCGIMVDDGPGVAVDNIPMRGCSGHQFTQINRDQLAAAYAQMDVGLIILQFGGNSVPYLRGKQSIDAYCTNMGHQIDRLHQCCPGAKILFIGPSDMSTRENGELQTYPALPLVVESLQQMANAHGAAFWSIYHAMGGYNSMAAWVDQGLGGPDYIHFSQRGVDIMGDRLSKAFDNMYHIYKMRKEVEDVQ